MPEEARRLAHSIEFWYRERYGLTRDDPRFTATYTEMITEFYAEQIKIGACFCKKCGIWFKGDYCHECGSPNEWRSKSRTCLGCKHEQVFGVYCSECGMQLPEPEGGQENIPKQDFGVVDAPVIEEDQIISWHKGDGEENEPGAE